jgi:hypothetical protein
MTSSGRRLFLNSTLAFVSAFFLTTMAHELGHFAAYIALGAHPILFHNAVETPGQVLAVPSRIIGALAGPVVSLLQGIALAFVVRKRAEAQPVDLLVLWLSLLGLVNFFGYLMMTPLSTVGDTGQVAELLHVPYAYRVLVAAAGLGILLLLVRSVGAKFSRFVPSADPLPAKKGILYQLILFPLLIGSGINTLFAFPVAATLSVIYPATSSFVIMTSFGTALRASATAKHRSRSDEHLSVPLIVLTGAMMVIDRILTSGWG